METAAIGDEETPVVYLLGEKYVKTLENLSQSDNSKSLSFPADILAAIKGIMGKMRGRHRRVSITPR